VRVVPNKYPAFSLEDQVFACGEGICQVMSGVGTHEVIVGSPDHYKSLALLTDSEVAQVICAYRDRYIALSTDPRIQYILIIVNQGAKAGASLEHPHSQLFAIPMIPLGAREELEGVAKYLEEKGSCIYCDLIGYERGVGERFILESEFFVAFAPYASRVPFETWILPKEHHSAFETMSWNEIQSLAWILRQILGKLHRGLNDPPYNLYLHTAPCQDGTFAYYHWHIEILPKLSIIAGFELGAGMMINVVKPEEAAAFLRETG